MVSLKDPDALLQTDSLSPAFIPHINNYLEALKRGMSSAFGRTALICLISVSVSCTLCAMTAYVLSRFHFRGKQTLTRLILLSALIPTMTMQVYVFRMMARINLTNTLHGYAFLLCGIDIVPISLFMRYFSTIPESIDEAAILDGCSYTQVFALIHLPLLKQAFFTAGILRLIYVYNEYALASIYLLDKSRCSTVTTALHALVSPRNTNYPIVCAGVILAILPAVLLFMLFQRRIYNGLCTPGHQVLS